MKVISKGAAEAMLHYIKQSVESEAPKSRTLEVIDIYLNHINDTSWNDPDYSMTREAKIAKKINGKWIPIDELK